MSYTADTIDARLWGQYNPLKENAGYPLALMRTDAPFTSPVPLETLEYYELIYSSEGSKMKPDGEPIPEVKIFAYIAG